MKRVLVLMAVSVIALAVTAVAFGASSALLGQYGGLAGEVQKQVPLATQQGVQTQGTLPFTGLDLALMAGGALLLLLTGWTLRRAGRDKA